jgi:hypothetical protein
MGPTSMYSLGGMCVGSYDNMGHCTQYSDLYSANNLNLYQNLTQQEAIDQFYATQVAYLSQKLNRSPEPAARCWISRWSAGATSWTWAPRTTTTTRPSC